MCGKLALLIFFTLVLGLSAGQAQEIEWDRAAYWDGRYRTWWADEAVTTAIRDGLEAAGYTILDAGELRTWMNARIADRALSVVVFCRDNAPDTVAEFNSSNCTLRRYLNAGGKIVWYSDIPFWEIAHSNGNYTYWGGSGCANVLGIPGVDWTNNTNTEVTLTDDGRAWGLTATWTSTRWTPADDTFTVLATDGTGRAAAWVKHFVPGDKYRGFVRIWDVDVSPGNRPSINDIIRVAEYMATKASNPNPLDGAIYLYTWVSLAWTAGAYATSHDVYFGENFADVDAGTGGTFQGNQFAMSFLVGFSGHPYPDGLVPGTTYYWRIDEVDPDNTYKGDVWSFTVPLKKAFGPNPADGAKFVDTSVTLAWTPGLGAGVHTVYFGDDFDVVSNATRGTTTGFTTYSPGPLELNKVYYWRVDETDALGTYKGDVWSFTTAGTGGGVRGDYYNGMNFESYRLTRMDPQINFTWPDGTSPDPLVNQDQFSVRWTGELEAVFTETYTFYARADDGVRLWVDGQQLVNGWVAQSPTEYSGAIDLVAGHTYHIQMEMYEDGVGAVAELRWESPRTPKQLIPQAALSPLVKANSPNPPQGATGVKMTPILTWNPGDYAASHEVYFGTDKDAVKDATAASPEYKGTKALGSESHEPGKLAWANTYYWRVDEVNSVNPDSPWIGSVWSFTTGNFLTIDDFEDYGTNDNQIWYAWHDGTGYGAPGVPPYYAGNDSGSTIGDEATASGTEESIVNSGGQSMPYFYDNNKQVCLTYSEAVLTLTDQRDWTEEQVKALSLCFQGYPGSVGSFTEGPAGTYTMTASGYDIWFNADNVEADEFHFACKTLTGPGTIVAKVESVQNTNGWAKAGVMIRETLDPGSAHAFACITPSNGVASQGRPYTGGASFSAAQGGITAPHWVKLERDVSDNFTVYHSSNGLTWEPVQNDTPHNIQMNSNAYIGLAVTAHDPALICEAVFSNVTITHTIDPQWMHQDIGILSNDPEPMYVALANSTGPPAVVYHDDPNAAQIDTWTEWNIDLRDFADQDVNLADVNSITIGFGDRNNPQAGGSGKMYFDDIRLYRSRCVPSEITLAEADLNSDCVVDYRDLEMMVGDWLAGDPGLAADLNADDTDDFKDYAVLANQWLEEQVWPQ
jgi:hypothetical protein